MMGRDVIDMAKKNPGEWRMPEAKADALAYDLTQYETFGLSTLLDDINSGLGPRGLEKIPYLQHTVEVLEAAIKASKQYDVENPRGV